VPTLGTVKRILACDTFKHRQIGTHPPDRPWTLPYHVHDARSATYTRRITEFFNGHSCRFHHTISGSGTA
jgi:hypothetical protein